MEDLQLKGETLLLHVPAGQRDKLLSAFYAWCIDNKIDAILIPKSESL